MNQYLLLLHEIPADSAELTPAQMQDIIDRHQLWAQQLAERGLLAGGAKLTDDGGIHLRLKHDRPVASDGPYAEAHDVIGGFYMILAADDTAAQALAIQCPHLHGRQWVELRKVDPID